MHIEKMQYLIYSELRRGGRVVEGAALEKRYPLWGSWVRIPPSPPSEANHLLIGEVLEWPIRRAWKARVPFIRDRGFESHPLRHTL